MLLLELLDDDVSESAVELDELLLLLVKLWAVELDELELLLEEDNELLLVSLATVELEDDD